eukprot:17241-Heterococcus_DN1.PRE.5
MLYCSLRINAFQAPGALLLALARAGINIAPTTADTAALQAGGAQHVANRSTLSCCCDDTSSVDAAAACSVTMTSHSTGRGCVLLLLPLPLTKQLALEEAWCVQLASVAAAFELKSSRWNSHMGSQRCTLQARESSAFTGGNDDVMDLIDFSLALLEHDGASDTAAHAPAAGCLPATALMLYDVMCAACVKCVVMLQCTLLQASMRQGRALGSFSSTAKSVESCNTPQTLLRCYPYDNSD